MPIEATTLLEEKTILPEEPCRIVSLTPAITDTLVMLGLHDRIVGISSFCQFYVPEVKGKPIVGSYLDIKWDKLRELYPDLVLVGMGVQAKVVQVLRDRGYNVYTIPLPTSFCGILDNLLRISYVTNTYSRGLRIYEDIVKKMARLIEGTSSKVRAYVEIWVGEPRTIGQTSYIDDSLRLIGVENIYSHTRQPYPKPDPKYIAEQDPDYIIVSNEMARIDVEELVRERNWSNLKAVREKKIIILGIDKPLAHPSPRIINVLEHLYKIIWG